jgi:hypothetical protein
MFHFLKVLGRCRRHPMPIAEAKETVEPTVATAIQKAKAKNARLRLMKERNENYLAERRDEEDESIDDLIKELQISNAE